MRAHKIMLVEDEKNIRKNIQEFLEIEGYTVVSFSDTTEAVKSVHTNFFSLVISDILMPGLDGIELFKIIRAIPAFQQIPFLFITAKPIRELKSLLEKSNTYFIEKPFSLLTIAEKIQKIL